jgi:hypothetical protein
MEEFKEKKTSRTNSLSAPAVLAGWAITVGGFLWTAAAKDAEYSHKITQIEKELIFLDERLDTAESFRIEIKTSLAQIQTDLIWIRRELEEK